VKSEARGTEKTTREYKAPPGMSDFALTEAYENALRAAGWDPVCRTTHHEMDASYTKNGRDIGIYISSHDYTPSYSITVVDTGSGLRADLKKNCKAPLYGVNFDFDKATLRADSEPALNQILSVMKDEPKLSLEIGGHTDNVGKPDYNMKLSDERAAAVRQWLVAHGVAALRLTSRGYGDTQPVVPNNSDENRAKNRRVEVKCSK
jgi:outer membrane protein OmpA-like peptidoglycan-associated protein